MTTTYTLRYRVVGSGDEGWTTVSGLTGTSHALTGLTPGARYDVEVTAVSGERQSLATVAQRSTVCSAPSQPTVLPAGYALSVGDEETNGRLAVSDWGAPTGARGYLVRTRETGVGEYAQFGSEVAGTSVTVTGLNGARSYDVEVFAVNQDGLLSAASTARTNVPARIAEGGTVTRSVEFPSPPTPTTYLIHRFTSSGQFELHRSLTDVEYLIVGGGGGGGSRHGGGGGAGGMLAGPLASVSAATHTITVGDGGRGALAHNNNVSDPANFPENGEQSSALGLTAEGGGRGSNSHSGSAVGGSGGGANKDEDPSAGTPGQGYSGGRGLGSVSAPSVYAGGGGGGAGGSGGAASGTAAGSGGLGAQSTISGTPEIFAGGGGGSTNAAGGGGSGGSSIGGAGATGSQDGGDGVVNTGSGGGGGGYDDSSTPQNKAGGSGGSGIVIIRYELPA